MVHWIPPFGLKLRSILSYISSPLAREDISSRFTSTCTLQCWQNTIKTRLPSSSLTNRSVWLHPLQVALETIFSSFQRTIKYIISLLGWLRLLINYLAVYYLDIPYGIVAIWFNLDVSKTVRVVISIRGIGRV